MPVQVRLSFLTPDTKLTPDSEPDIWATVRVDGFTTPCMVCIKHKEFFTKDHVGILADPEVREFSKKHRRRLSKKQERRVAEGVGGRAQCGSGALPGNKGDGRVYGRLRIENKFTTKKSYSVKRSDLDKIRAECQGRETPVFQIDFRDPAFNRLEDSWVLIPEQVWRKLIRDTSDDS